MSTEGQTCDCNKLFFQIRLFIAIMAGTSTTRVTRSASGSRNMIEIPGGEKSEPLSTELIKSLLCMGFGRPVWEKLLQSHGTQTSTGTWAAVATKVSPGAIEGSRWVLKGSIRKTLNIREIYSNDEVNEDEEISIACELEEFEFPADRETRNASDWKDLLADQGTSMTQATDQVTEEMVRETGLLGRLVVNPTSVREADVKLQVIPLRREDLQANCEKAGTAMHDLHVPAIMVMQLKANLVPLTQEGRGEHSGFGLLPMLWTDSTVDMTEAQLPSTAMLKEELFKFLHSLMEPEPILTRPAWAKVWRGRWKRPRIPKPQWPLPPRSVVSANAGMYLLN